MNMDEPVVIDLGSYRVKVGFSKDECPHSVPSLVAPGDGIWSRSCGDDARRKNWRRSPIQNGYICNYDDLEYFMQYIYKDKLKLDPTFSEHPVLVIDNSGATAQREKLAQIMLEVLKIPAVSIFRGGPLPLYNHGLSRGVVVDLGHGVSQIVPVWDNVPVRGKEWKGNFGGKNIEDFFVRCLHYLTPAVGHPPCLREMDMIRDMKEKLACVAPNYEKRMRSVEYSRAYDASYPYVVGETITPLTLTAEQFTCAELPFNPLMHWIEMDGIHKILHDTIQACPEYMHKDLYKNIVISGGTTKLAGFAERLRNEMRTLALSGTDVDVKYHMHRELDGWFGAAKVANGEVEGVQPKWFTSEVYQQKGYGAVHDYYT